MSPTPRVGTPRRACNLSCAALLLISGLAPSKAEGQRVPPGFSEVGLTITVIDKSYAIQGNTAQALLDQMRTLGPGGRWTSFPYRSEWTYQIRRVLTAGGVETARCGVGEFELLYTVNAVFPRWTSRGDASDELIEAWNSFEDLILANWETRRRYLISLSREVSRRVQNLEDLCPILEQKANNLVRDLSNQPNPAEREVIGDAPRSQLRWPPPGYEELLPERVTRPLPGRPIATESPERAFADAAAADVSPSGMTGVVAGRLRTDEVEFLEAFGFADLEEQEPLTAEAVFRFPAFTEVIVSALAATLAREGLVDLHAPLSSLLPDLDPRLGAVSLDHLLSHRSGLDDAAPSDSVWSEILADLDDRAVFTDPGAVFSFSRYDYPLALHALGRSIEGDVVVEASRRVFEPLGMESTSLGEATEGLPVLLTTAPDLLRFGSAWIDSDAGSVPPPSTDAVPATLLDGRGRAFHRGLWRDLVGGQTRVSLMCAAGSSGDAAGVQIFPDSGMVLVFWSRARTSDRVWPGVATRFLLEGIGSDLGMGRDVFEPQRVRGDGQLDIGPRPCEEPIWNSLRASDPGPPAPAGDWAGQYANGDRVFVLQERGGVLWITGGVPMELEVKHFKDDMYLATMGDRPLWPFRLVRDDLGRRYAVLGDRAHIHEDDRPGT